MKYFRDANLYRAVITVHNLVLSLLAFWSAEARRLWVRDYTVYVTELCFLTTKAGAAVVFPNSV